MPDKKFKIIAKTNAEKECKKILIELIKKYNLPILHNKVIIKEGNSQRSFPDILFNPMTEPIYLIYIYVHEMLHNFADTTWAMSSRKNWEIFGKMCVKYFPNYKKIGKEFEPRPPWNFPFMDTFPAHVIVCFNTMMIIKKIFSRKKYKEFFSRKEHDYVIFDTYLLNNYSYVKKFLKKYNLIYNYNTTLHR